MAFLGRKLRGRKGKEGDAGGGGVFCYVNSVFAPGLDEGVGGLWRVSACFLLFLSGGRGGKHEVAFWGGI